MWVEKVKIDILIDIVPLILSTLLDIMRNNGYIVVLFFWAAFIAIYSCLGKYEKAQSKSIGKGRISDSKEQTYHYSLHMYGGLSLLILLFDKREDFDIEFFVIFSQGIHKELGNWIGLFCLVIGLHFVIWGRIYLNGYWAKDCYKYTNHELVTEAPYAKCRHPIYFGQICMIIGTTLIFNTIIHGIIGFIIIIVNSWRGIMEDRYLSKVFCDKWKTYKNKTPFILPLGWGKEES